MADAWADFRSNLERLPQTLWRSVRRRGEADSERSHALAIFANLFLHVHSVKVHRHSLKPSYTLGLGLLTTAFLVIVTVTGVLLMVYYKPTPELAYDSVKDIHFVVPTGRLIRNLHRWAAHGMVVAVFLHMARVFYTASYRPPREFNWLVGIALLALTLALSFTGYLLPWDQLAYWAVTIGVNIASSPRELTDALGITSWLDPGGFLKQLLLGANTVGAEALIRFHLLHVMVLPLLLFSLLGVHFWRIRKDGGLSRPEAEDVSAERTVINERGGIHSRRAEDVSAERTVINERGGIHSRRAEDAATEPAATKTYGLMAVVRGTSPAVGRGPENTVSAWPHLLVAEGAALMAATALVLGLSLLSDAPLKEAANPAVPENPAKAPWYFLGVQELVSYSAFMGGVVIPAVALLGLALIPYLDRENGDVGLWFSGRRGRRVAASSLVFSLAALVSLLAFLVRFGWLRQWFPAIPQLVLIFVNPGTVYTLLFAAWSLFVLKRFNSTRMGAVALFTCFLVGYTVLTYVGTVHRGPNWGFYWRQADWPVH